MGVLGTLEKQTPAFSPPVLCPRSTGVGGGLYTCPAPCIGFAALFQGREERTETNPGPPGLGALSPVLQMTLPSCLGLKL